jgi:hypothetical protein
VRERRKEPREGSEIDPETACIQTVGAPALLTFEDSFEEPSVARRLKRINEEIDSSDSFEERAQASDSKDLQDEIDPDDSLTYKNERVI